MTIAHKHPLERNSKQPKVRAASMRKSGRDGTTWTGTEKYKRNKLLRQFQALESGTQASSPEFCEGWERTFGHRKDLRAQGLCPDCLKAACECPPPPYRITHHGKVEPVIILSEAEGGDPYAD